MTPSTNSTIGALCDRGAVRIQTGPFGSQLHAHEYRSAGTAVIPTEAIGKRRITNSALPHVSSDVADRLARHKLVNGDILFARRGAQATGLSAIITAAHEGALCGTGAILLRTIDRDVVDPGFLSFALTSSTSIQWLKEHAVGAVMPNLNADIIRRLEIRLPPLPEQQAIAHILGTLDDKIELNLRTSETLEAMAGALFTSWFVEHLSSDAVAEVSAQTLAEQNVLQVGDGYRAKNSELGEPGLPFARAGNIKNGFAFDDADHLQISSVELAGEKISRAFDIVFTSKGTVGRFAFVDSLMEPFVYSPQLCYWRSLDHRRLNPFVLYQWMMSRWFLSQVDRVKGQTDMAEYVSLRDQRRMLVPLPPEDSQRRIGELIEPVRQRIWAATAESKTLSLLRDSLLPKLLSGEILASELIASKGAP